MIRRLVAAAIVLAPALATADDTTAVALHDQGIKDMQAGSLEVGCKELAKSLELAPDSGTQGALATCYTKQTKLASAWTLWKNLADTAPTDGMRTDARALATALEPRLPHFVVKLAAPAPAGLVVTVNGVEIDPSLPVPLPIDPGPLAASAHAPDHASWSQSFTAAEAQTLTIEVPALAQSAPTPTQPPMPTPTPGGMVNVEPAGHSRHVRGLIVGAAGVVVLGVGTLFGVQASSKWSDAKTVCGGDIDHCTNVSGSQGDVNSARTAATESTISFAVGGAAVILGAILYVTAPSDVERTALRVTPSLGSSGAGFVLSGGF
jgi:hypothetical protein